MPQIYLFTEYLEKKLNSFVFTEMPRLEYAGGKRALVQFCFCKSKQKSDIIHFRRRMLNSPATSAEQIRTHIFILHFRMKEISAGDKERQNKKKDLQ